MRRLALTILLLCACLPPGGALADDAPPGPDPCTAAQPGGGQNFGFGVDGMERVAHLHVPLGTTPAGQRLPLLVALHGYGGSGSGMESFTGLSTLGDRERFMTVYPDAMGPMWAIHDGSTRGAEDIEFVHRLIDDLERRFCVNASRVFVVGVSNGGGEAERLACAMPDKLAGVALVAGLYSNLPPCQPERPVSILEIHAETDRVAPYFSRVGGVPNFLAMWRALDHCTLPGSHHRVDAESVTAEWACAAGTRVAQVRIQHGGHFWPGATEHGALPGPGSAAAQIWDFFRRLP